VDTIRISFFMSSVARNLWTAVEGNLGLSHPARPTTPRILPAIIASFRGLKEALHLPPCMYSMYSCEKPAITGNFSVIWLPFFVLFGKLSIAVFIISLAIFLASWSLNWKCIAPGIFTFWDVVIIFVWNFFATSTSEGIMHCTSTTIASIRPVITDGS